MYKSRRACPADEILTITECVRRCQSALSGTCFCGQKFAQYKLVSSFTGLSLRYSLPPDDVYACADDNSWLGQRVHICESFTISPALVVVVCVRVPLCFRLFGFSFSASILPTRVTVGACFVSESGRVQQPEKRVLKPCCR